VEEPEAGVLYPERTIATLARLALAHSAALHGHEPAREWSASGDGVEVRTDVATYSADRLVISPGAWASDLLGSLGIALHVTRQVQLWVAPPDPAPFALGAMPLWAVQHPEVGLQYGFPVMPDAPGLKIAKHHPGETTDPDNQRRQPAPDDTADMRVLLGSTLPSALGPVIALETCMYTNSPDHHFIIDTHPAHENVAFACGFSGHGFKFTPVVGEILADLALDGTTALPAQFLGLDRFKDAAQR
jgi:sarcosine oxidase